MKGLRIKLGCKADRMAIDECGVLEVLDYKTNASGRLPTAESLTEDLPTFLYYILTRICYPDHKAVRVSQLNVLTLAKVEVEYDEAQVTANKKSFIASARAFATSAFEPAPSEACAWCSVQDSCPALNREADFDSLIQFTDLTARGAYRLLVRYPQALWLLKCSHALAHARTLRSQSRRLIVPLSSMKRVSTSSVRRVKAALSRAST